MSRPPNLLVIVADDHADRVRGAAGDAQAHTPHMDALAAESARLTNLFCTAPLCTPARGSLLTGLMPPRSGVQYLDDPLADGTQTLARQLRDSGYRTACFGKMHFLQDGRPGMHGFDICRNDLNWYNPDHHPSSPDPSIPTLPPWRPFEDPARVWLNADRLPYPAYDRDKPNRRVADEARGFLAETHERPFCCWVGFNQPHCPFNVPIDARIRSDPADFTLPTIGSEDRGRIPQIFRDLDDDDQRGVIAAYHDAVAYLDELLGSVLQQLDDAGLRDDTIVLYTADHGYLLGEHGRFEKHCHFEEALRVPGLLRWPSHIAARDIDGLCSAVDLAPTLLALCGAAALPEQDGYTLDAQLLDEQHDWPRDAIASVYAANREACLRDARYKFIARNGEPATPDPFNDAGDAPPWPAERLYDLAGDPQELHDRAAAEPERCDAMRRRLPGELGLTAHGGFL